MEKIVKREPIFSFLIANYNNRAYISDLLDSILAQTVPSWEAIIVDDGSSDGGIADIISEKYDERFVYIRQERNCGAAHAWNIGFTLSRGAFFPVIGADDILDALYLEKVWEAFQKNNDINVVYVDLELFGIHNVVSRLPEQSIADLTIKQWLPHGGACLKREVMERTGGYYEGEELRHGNIDWDFWLSAVKKGHFKVKRIPEPLYRYRQHAHNMTKMRGFYEYMTRECIYRRHKEFFKLHGNGEKFLASGYFESAAAYWGSGEYKQSIVLAVKGASLNPPISPRLPDITGSVAELARSVTALERYFKGLNVGAYAPTEQNFENRVRLIGGYLALRQWGQAEENLCIIFSSALGSGNYVLAAHFAVLLSLLYLRCGKREEAQQAANLAGICNPFNLEALYLRIKNALVKRHCNEAVQLFNPWISNQNKEALIQVVPYIAMLAKLSGRNVAWIEERLRNLPKWVERKSHNECSSQIYALPLGRRLVWEFRAKDLYEKWGGTEGGHEALREALELTCAKSVLEVGCGNGRNLVLFSRLGLECVGQDISAAALELARQRNLPRTTLICRPLPEVDFPDGKFDIIVCNRVLQHVAEEELSAMLDAIVRLGHFVYLNELAPEDTVKETWYEKKYNLTSMMEARGMQLIARISDSEVKHAIVFGKYNLEKR